MSALSRLRWNRQEPGRLMAGRGCFKKLRTWRQHACSLHSSLRRSSSIERLNRRRLSILSCSAVRRSTDFSGTFEWSERLSADKFSKRSSLGRMSSGPGWSRIQVRCALQPATSSQAFSCFELTESDADLANKAAVCDLRCILRFRFVGRFAMQ